MLITTTVISCVEFGRGLQVDLVRMLKQL